MNEFHRSSRRARRTKSSGESRAERTQAQRHARSGGGADWLEPDTEATNSGPTATYFVGVKARALLSRDEELELGARLVAARKHIQSLLASAERLVDTALPTEERGVTSPIEDFRERETLLIVAKARSACGRGRSAHAAIGFKSSAALLKFVTEIEAALAKYRVARDLMIEANLRLVLSLARRYRRAGVQYLDLVQEGTLGLIRAVEKYDPVRDVRFGTYAVWWIWQQIGRAGDQSSSLIRTPMHWQQMRRVLSREAQRLEAKGLRFEREHLAKASGIDEERIEAVSQNFHYLSLTAPVGGEDDRPLEETIASELRSPESNAAAKDLIAMLERALGELPQREAEVLRWRFGTSARSTLTLEEIGERLGVSRERVRQIEVRALRRLQPICTKKGLHAYFD